MKEGENAIARGVGGERKKGRGRVRESARECLCVVCICIHVCISVFSFLLCMHLYFLVQALTLERQFVEARGFRV